MISYRNGTSTMLEVILWVKGVAERYFIPPRFRLLVEEDAVMEILNKGFVYEGDGRERNIINV